MTEKLVSVKNTLDRYFNWAKKNQIIKVPASDVEYYKRNWFVVVEEIKAIVKNEEPTKAEIIKELEKLWIEFNKKAKKEELEALLEKAKKEFEENKWKDGE